MPRSKSYGGNPNKKLKISNKKSEKKISHTKYTKSSTTFHPTFHSLKKGKKIQESNKNL